MKIIDAFVTAESIVKKHLAIKPNEEVVLVADSETDMEIVYTLAGVIKSVGADYTIAIMPNRDHSNSAMMTKFIDKGLEAADVLIGVTKASGAPCYSAVAQQMFYDGKIRTMSMVFRNLNHFTKGGATADYDEIVKNADRLADIWRNGKEIHVTSKKGTDLRAPIVKERVRIENGFATKVGDECAFSDGEVFMYPVAGVDGIAVIDGPIYRFGLPEDIMKIKVNEGKAISIEGNGDAVNQLKEIVFSVENAENFAELAIGLNPCSLINGDFEEEKKALGNVHFALGKTPVVYSAIHMDLIMREGTVEIDNKLVLKDGKLMI
ncbi:aminopeptidase [Virgibacillus byunsanensis]|uniref:Aminopeptidase n=1 Tax=Virgibacillus byunsanensis TaxID=570945 RepID=A0ABW3LHV5_9BACI